MTIASLINDRTTQILHRVSESFADGEGCTAIRDVIAGIIRGVYDTGYVDGHDGYQAAIRDFLEFTDEEK